MCRQGEKVIVSNPRSETRFIDGEILLGKRHILIIQQLVHLTIGLGCTASQSRRFKISRKISQTMIVAIIA